MTQPPEYGPQPTDPYAGAYSPYPPDAGWGPPPAPPRDRLGARGRRRPYPRIGTTLGGAGAALVLIGLLVWAGDYYGDGGGSRRFLGAVFFAGATAAGYALAIARRTAAPGTAGAVLATFGLPLTFGFLTLDPGSFASDGYPFNVDLVSVLSIAVWLVSYLLVPGLRGRALLLGAAAFGLFGYVSLKATDLSSASRAGASAFGFGHAPGTSTLTALGLAFGLAYYLIAAMLDARGRTGSAVALVAAGFDATVGGVIFGASDMGQGGTGALLIVLGLVLSGYGARFGRRFTAWAWAAGLVLGCLLVVDDIFGVSGYVGGGLTLAVLGVLLIAGASWLSRALREAPETDEAAPQPAGAPV